MTFHQCSPQGGNCMVCFGYRRIKQRRWGGSEESIEQLAGAVRVHQGVPLAGADVVGLDGPRCRVYFPETILVWRVASGLDEPLASYFMGLQFSGGEANALTQVRP